MLRHDENRVANAELTENERANVELRLKLLMAHARFRGWIVDKKQVDKKTVVLDLGAELRKLGGGELRKLLAEHLNKLSPGARARIEAIADPAIDVESE